MLKHLRQNQPPNSFIYFFFSLLLCLSLLSTALAQETSLRKRRVNTEEPLYLLGKESLQVKKLEPGQKHTYQIPLKQGDYLSLGITRKDADIVATLFDPNDKKLVEVASINRPQDPEIGLYLLIDITGNYLLNVTTDKAEVSANYLVKIKDLRASNKNDKQRIASQAAYDEAEKLRSQNTKDSLQKAFNIYNSLLPIWREIGEYEGEGTTLNAIGAIYFTAAQYKESQEHLEQALKIWKDLNNPLWEVATLTGLGAVCNSNKDNRQALNYYLKAQQVANNLNDPQWLVFALNGLGKVSSDLGELAQALNYYKEALVIKRSLQDKRGEAVALSNIANTYISLQNYPLALDYHLESLAVFKGMGDISGEASTLNNLGRSYMLLNDPVKALESFNLALKKKQELQDLRGQATTFNNIGYLHMVASEQKEAKHFLHSNHFNYVSNQKALDAFNQALEIWQKLNDSYEEQTTLALMLRVYTSLGDQENIAKFSQQIMTLNKASNVDKDTNNRETSYLANTNTVNQTNSFINITKSAAELPKPTTPEISQINIPNKRTEKTSIKTNSDFKDETPKVELPKTEIKSEIDKDEMPKTATLKTAIPKANKTTESNNSIINNKVEKGKFSIQVGALSTKEEADVLCKRLQNNGLESYVAEGNARGKIVFRVRMGSFQSMEEAKKAAAELKAKGSIGQYFIATQ